MDLRNLFNKNKLTRQQMLGQSVKQAANLIFTLTPLGIAGAVARNNKVGYEKLELTRLLNVILQMEFLLRNFYKKTHNKNGLIPASYQKAVDETYLHHANHIFILKDVIYSIQKEDKAAPSVSGNFKFEGLKPENNFDDFLLMAQLLEDACASLYKKCMLPIRKELDGSKKLQRLLLQLHTTQGRHSAYFRMIRAERGTANVTPWIADNSSNAVLPKLKFIYKNEDKFIQNDINLSEITALPLSTLKEAWDEPCDNEAINNLFVLLEAEYF